ncbi:MAG: TetR family transcriptional regulator [Acidimicrobiales bacterium]|nr:TetR family transcriptional regulator [Acidimicrobiales bacterium]
MATTVAQIAEAAGVALQSVYKVGGSKAELLHQVSDLAVAGDGQDVRMADRDEIRRIGDEPDPAEQLAIFASVHVRIMDRALPIFAAEREAAAVDPRAAAVVEEQAALRLETYRRIIDMIEPTALRADLGCDGAVDLLWTVASPEVALQLRRVRGWSRARHERWLRQTLVAALLHP